MSKDLKMCIASKSEQQIMSARIRRFFPDEKKPLPTAAYLLGRCLLAIGTTEENIEVVLNHEYLHHTLENLGEEDFLDDFLYSRGTKGLRRKRKFLRNLC